MTRTLPIILVLLLALGVFLVDPARPAAPMMSPESLPTAEQGLAQSVGTWNRDPTWDDTLPIAYPPHNEVLDTSARYMSSATGAEAFLRVVIAQDRRDLLAFEPTHAMRAGGWSSIGAEESSNLWQTRHTRHSDLVDEFLVVDTAFVIAGLWGPTPGITHAVSTGGPGWPGPGAIVQVLHGGGSAAADADILREEARRVADRLATELATAGTR